MFERFWWNLGKKLSSRIEDMRIMLKMAKMRYTAEEYMAICAKNVFTALFLISILLFLVFFLVFKAPLLFSAIISILIGISSSSIVFLIFLWYPKSIAEGRKRKIENMLPFVAFYMSTIASSGVPPYMLFKTIARFKEFGEIARECEDIANSMEIFGLTFTEAIERAMRFSPSEKWREFLASMLSTITTGGDLRAFLLERAERYTEEFRRNLQSFSQTVSLMLDVYITLVLVGTIMTTVVTMIMGIMGGVSGIVTKVQYFIALFLIPVATAMFILMIKAISPLEV